MLYLTLCDDDKNDDNCNNNFNGKSWAIVGPQLSGPPLEPDSRGSSVCYEETCRLQNSVPAWKHWTM